MKKLIKLCALAFVLLLCLWASLEIIPQLFTAADTLTNVLGLFFFFVSIIINSIIIIKIKQTIKKQKK